MSLLDLITSESEWKKFYGYKTGLAVEKRFAKDLESFIAEKRYIAVGEIIKNNDPFPLPRKAVISKMSSLKKRTVYIYPGDENIVLKFLTYKLIRRYDHLFSPNLYSFRAGTSAKEAIRNLVSVRGIREMYAYKVDISNYFNSIPIDRLIPELKEVLSDDPELAEFLTSLLEVPYVIDSNGGLITEQKGIMAGSPQASFYANLYLRELDRWFQTLGIPYARYSDDIIVFAPTREECEAHASFIREQLISHGLTINPDKEAFFTPEEGFIFLGFSYRAGVVDIAPASIAKIKAKMRRKARALKRWKDRRNKGPDNAAAAFIRVFNRKLYISEGELDDNELSWSKWYFPVINTAESLRVIDRYAQDCVRYIMSGKRNKSRFRVTYQDMKELGLKSLVHSYYAYEEDLS